jgi:hypothetical protein
VIPPRKGAMPPGMCLGEARTHPVRAPLSERSGKTIAPKVHGEAVSVVSTISRTSDLAFPLLSPMLDSRKEMP